MRVIYLLILLFLVGVVAVFAVQNRGSITLQFLDRSVSSPASLLIVLVYLLGMVSGWTVVGVGRRAFQHIMARPSHE
jgi:lipopolysaccharide assembly protein A